MKQKKIIVECDDREPKSMDMIAMLEGGIEFVRKRLEVGDYVWNNVCIERKEINDFCASIVDGRFEGQIEKMLHKYKHNYVLVVGCIKDRTSEIHEHCILGKIASLLVRHKVSVVCVDDEFQVVYLIKRIMEKHREVKDGEEKQ